MKDNKYMENIDELMKFVFEGRLLGVDAQTERRRLQELKSYGILEEDNDICKCYKQIINLLNDNKKYILDVLYKKNKKLKVENINVDLWYKIASIICAIFMLFFISIFPDFWVIISLTAVSLVFLTYTWYVNSTLQTRIEYFKVIKAIKKKIRMYGPSLSETKELVKENKNEEQPKQENRLEAIPKEIEYYYALIKDNMYEGYLNDVKELSSIYHKYIEITMPSDDLTKDNYQINLVLNDKLSKLLNDLNALERKIDLNIKKQERQDFYQSRISTLDEELAVDRLDTGYDSKSLKRTLKK